MKLAALTFLFAHMLLSSSAAPAPDPAMLEHAGNIFKESTMLFSDGMAQTFNMGQMLVNAVVDAVTGSSRLAMNTAFGAGNLAKNVVGASMDIAGQTVQATAKGLGILGSGVASTGGFINDLSAQQTKDLGQKAADATLNGVKSVGNVMKTTVGSTISGTGSGFGMAANALQSVSGSLQRTGDAVNNLSAKQLQDAASNGVTQTMRAGQKVAAGTGLLFRTVTGTAIAGAGNGISLAGNILKSAGDNISRTGNALNYNPQQTSDPVTSWFKV